MQPNLVRISADGDERAEEILRRIPDTISESFLETLDSRDNVALARYGARQVTVALREGSTILLTDALLATAAAELQNPGDPRDLMVDIAVHFVVAERLGVDPSLLFNDVAARLPVSSVADLLRHFGARNDISLHAFGWQLVETESGPDFAPDYP
ncbi:hypothetical protein ACIA8C_35180 [Nocardia sp. NPDC051321]|uniref:hypothetical protein n=1 Tax=Nocardia sp. NPDC051321 TaxID=3364323 RepID=UPI00379AF3B3